MVRWNDRDRVTRWCGEATKIGLRDGAVKRQRQGYEMVRWSDRDRSVSLYRRTAALAVTLIRRDTRTYSN